MGNETPNKTKQVAIVGAGPAGKSLAIVMHSLAELKAMTVEQLVEHVTELFGERALIIAEREDFEQQVKELTELKDAHIDEISGLNLRLTELISANTILEAFKEEASEQISELSQELSKAKVVADEFDPTIKHKGVEYGILGKKFTWKGKEHTIKSLQGDSKLQAELIAANVGFLIPKSNKPAEDSE